MLNHGVPQSLIAGIKNVSFTKISNFKANSSKFLLSNSRSPLGSYSPSPSAILWYGINKVITFMQQHTASYRYVWEIFLAQYQVSELFYPAYSLLILCYHFFSRRKLTLKNYTFVYFSDIQASVSKNLNLHGRRTFV